MGTCRSAGLTAPVPVLVAAYWWPRTVALVGAALLIPLVMAGVAYGIKDERGWQREAVDLAVAYTHRFPQGRLHHWHIVDQYESVLDTCALRGPTPTQTGGGTGHCSA